MKSFFAVILALPLLAVASPLEVRTDGCGGGTFQCCQSSYTSWSKEGSKLLQTHGLTEHPDAHNGSIGSNCDAGKGGICDSQAYCCSTAGLIAIGCISIPVSIGL